MDETRAALMALERRSEAAQSSIVDAAALSKGSGPFHGACSGPCVDGLRRAEFAASGPQFHRSGCPESPWRDLAGFAAVSLVDAYPGPR